MKFSERPDKEIVVIGTLGKNPVIDHLVQEGKLDVTDIAGRWETFLLQVVEQPLPTVDRALVTAQSQEPGGNSPRLEYQMYLFSSGRVFVRAYLSPTLNLHNTRGLQYAISFDDDEIQTIIMHQDYSQTAWGQSVANNIMIATSLHL